MWKLRRQRTLIEETQEMAYQAIQREYLRVCRTEGLPKLQKEIDRLRKSVAYWQRKYEKSQSPKDLRQIRSESRRRSSVLLGSIMVAAVAGYQIGARGYPGGQLSDESTATEATPKQDSSSILDNGDYLEVGEVIEFTKDGVVPAPPAAAAGAAAAPAQSQENPDCVFAVDPLNLSEEAKNLPQWETYSGILGENPNLSRTHVWVDLDEEDTRYTLQYSSYGLGDLTGATLRVEKGELVFTSATAAVVVRDKGKPSRVEKVTFNGLTVVFDPNNLEPQEARVTECPAAGAAAAPPLAPPAENPDCVFAVDPLNLSEEAKNLPQWETYSGILGENPNLSRTHVWVDLDDGTGKLSILRYGFNRTGNLIISGWNTPEATATFNSGVVKGNQEIPIKVVAVFDDSNGAEEVQEMKVVSCEPLSPR